MLARSATLAASIWTPSARAVDRPHHGSKKLARGCKQCDGKSAFGSGAGHPPEVRQRLGVARSDTASANAEGTDAAGALSDPRRGETATGCATEHLGSDGDVQSCHRITSGRCHRVAVVRRSIWRGEWRGFIPIRRRHGRRLRCRSTRKPSFIIQWPVGKHLTHVFSFRGKPIVAGQYEGLVNRALARAGMRTSAGTNLRHTWASWHVQTARP